MCGHPNTLEIKTIYFYIIKRIPYVSLHGSYHQKITDHLDCHLAIQLVTISFILSQENSIDSRIDESISQMRTHIINKNPESIAQITELLSRWRAIEPDDEIVEHVLFNANYGCNFYSRNLKSLKRWIKKNSQGSKLHKAISQEDIDLIKANPNLLFLMGHGFLSHSHPYNPEVDTFRTAEYQFIDVKPTETIADIGSGSGDHILTLAVMYPINGIYINEIEQELVDFLQYRVHFLQGLLMQDGREIEVKVGTDIEVNIPKEEVDLVIVRNTYHHFSMKSKMMESIISSLSSDGRIIIIEPLASKDKQANCNLKMDYQDIINGLRSHDISISRESIIEGTLFLELKN